MSVFQEMSTFQELSRPTTARRISSEEEALEEVARLAPMIRAGAIERDRERRLPYEPIRLLTEAGFYGITVPKEYGGADVSAVTVAEVFRMLSAADASVGQIPQNHFCWLPFFGTGSKEQAKFFYSRVLAGDRIGNTHSEDTRKRPGDYEHELKRVEGGWRMTGRKYYSTGAIFAQWIPFIADDGEQSCICFAVAKDSSITIMEDWTGMGQRTTASGTTFFKDVFVPDFNVFSFAKGASGTRPFGPLAGLIHAAIDRVIADEALAEAKEYILHRNRPWIDNPFDEHAKEPFAVQRFGELTVRVRTAGVILRHAGEAIDVLHHDPSPKNLLAARFAVADARIVTGEAATAIADEMFPLTGARATLEKYGLDRHWRNARTHTLHDPVRWKYYHIGNYFLNDVPPPPESYL